MEVRLSPRMRERAGRWRDGVGVCRGGGGAVGVWLLGRRLADERGQDVAEYAGVLVLATALIAAVVSLGLGTRLANAVRCLAGLSCQRRRHGGSGLLVLRDPVHE